jgi:NADPH:quinone reductase-like Zn-dependent oxidoreductase
MTRPTMLAAYREAYGSPDVVEVREIERPVPTGDGVLVRVHSASVNRADLDMILPKPGFLRPFLGIRRPRNPRVGVDVAGVVEAAGPDVTRLKPGDRVFADLFSWQGSFAEYTVAPERAFLPIPDGISSEVASTLPHSAVLAVQGLRRRDGSTFGRGAKVLIDGASGNVGPFAVQLAKARGAEVTGVCSPAKVDFVRSLGADHVIDYRATDYTKAGERYDWIVAADTHYPMWRIRHALEPGGLYHTLGGDGWSLPESLVVGPLLSLASGRHLGLMLHWKPFNADDVATVTDAILAGTVVPRIDRRYPLAEVRDALRYVDDGHASGKVVVAVGD